jgi:hypothetical protein
LKRRRDAQFYRIIFYGMIPLVILQLLVLMGFPIAWRLALFISSVGLALIWLIDALTVRLVVAGRHGDEV